MNNSKSDSNIQPEFINLRFLPGQRIIVLIVALCLFSIFGSVIIGLIMRNGVSGAETATHELCRHTENHKR